MHLSLFPSICIYIFMKFQPVVYLFPIMYCFTSNLPISRLFSFLLLSIVFSTYSFLIFYCGSICLFLCHFLINMLLVLNRCVVINIVKLSTNPKAVQCLISLYISFVCIKYNSKFCISLTIVVSIFPYNLVPTIS